MLKLVVAAALAVTPLALVTAPGGAAAATGPTHTLQVSGTGVGMYPAYDPSVQRYAATTTEATYPSDATDNTTNQDASITVEATTSDPHGQVLVDGVPITGGETTLTGLDAGTEISVIYLDSGGREADSVFLLPADFPTLTATVSDPAQTTLGMVGLTLSQWHLGNGWPNFDTVVDQNGVPAWVRASAAGGLDLKRQPNGHYSESRGPGATGQNPGSVQIVELDDEFKPIASYHTAAPLTQTDGHDSILEPNGSRVLLAYQPNPVTGKTDSVIQEVDPQGDVVFQWDSSALAGESVVTGNDYAHVNSVQIVNGGEDFLASFRNLSSVIEIARLPHDGYQPGDIVWKLGGRDSSFTFVDDPYDGPCGQHAASQLPNGDIMVFDDGSINGFGALCVDQSDPTGPVHERPQSRVAVWHLDPQTGIATLVSSYGPSGWFSWFMGSAQYLPSTQNTLVGWAAATQAVATEIDAADRPVWELRADPSSNGSTYLSYRALKFDVPDVTSPVVDVASPADGASYAYGASATLDFSCTDAGGSTLQTCGDVLPGTVLDTSTPGAHTVTVTAADGAGNTTTVTRHYTVEKPPAVYRPDMSVQRVDGTWLGRNIFGTLASQTTSRASKAGTTVSVPFRLTNAGNRPDACQVTGTRGTKAFTASYRYAGTDVTARVVAGTWRTPRTAVGARQVLRLRVHVGTGTTRGRARTFAVHCASTHAPSVTDGAGVRVTVR